MFARLRERAPTANAELDELHRQHARDHELVDELTLRVDALEAAAPGDATAKALQNLDISVKAYAAFLWDHMGREEAVILPAAQRHLTAQDWAHVDAAFKLNRDPNFGGETDKEYRHLFSRIANAANDWRRRAPCLARLGNNRRLINAHYHPLMPSGKVRGAKSKTQPSRRPAPDTSGVATTGMRRIRKAFR